MAAARLASEHDPMPTKPHVKPLALLVMADGTEDIETLTIYDTLVRGGVHVVTAQVGQNKMNLVHAMYGLRLRAQKSLEDCVYDRYDLIVLPGGLGANKLRDCDLLIRMLKLQKQEHRWYAAIGTSPAVVFSIHDLINGRATSHPTQVRFMGEQFVNEEVVVTNQCITSQGPGTAMKFSLTLLSLLCGQQEMTRVAQQLLYSIP